jgi:hypothetical protein
MFMPVPLVLTVGSRPLNLCIAQSWIAQLKTFHNELLGLTKAFQLT